MTDRRYTEMDESLISPQERSLIRLLYGDRCSCWCERLPTLGWVKINLIKDGKHLNVLAISDNGSEEEARKQLLPGLKQLAVMLGKTQDEIDTALNVADETKDVSSNGPTQSIEAAVAAACERVAEGYEKDPDGGNLGEAFARVARECARDAVAALRTLRQESEMLPSADSDADLEDARLVIAKHRRPLA